MKKKNLAIIFALLLPALSHADVATVMKVSKNKNEKNVLHYKVQYDKSSCEFTSGVYAEWKMDEEEGQWKPLSESMNLIKKPLWPNSLQVSGTELQFVTPAMEDFQQKKILSSSDIRLKVEFGTENGCSISNETEVRGQIINVIELKSNLGFLGGVNSVIVRGRTLDGRWYEETFKP